MRSASPDRLIEVLRRKRRSLPDKIHWELTYRCNLACGHCYCRGRPASGRPASLELRGKGCRGQEEGAAELPTREVKRLLTRLRREGCLWLSFTGGEPLLREDFLEIYGHAKKQGFLVTILSNGLLWNDPVIRFMKKSPPRSIEITVNGATARTYETVTGVSGSFERLRDRAGALFKSGLPVVVKSNLLKPNQGEIGSIKRWVEENLGRPKNGHLFRYDPHVYPRLDGDKAPLAWRLSYDEMEASVSSDPDMRLQFEDELARDFPMPEAAAGRLYQCSCWREQVFVSPDGFARFCPFSRKFGFDLTTVSLKAGVRRGFEPISGIGFRTRSKCRACILRPTCDWCPAKAELETGREERPVSDYCRYTERLARETALRNPNGKKTLFR